MPKASLTVILRKILKILAWIFVSFLILFVIISITLQFSSVQTWLTEKILSQLSEEVQSHVSIDRVAIRFPKSVGLEGIFVEDTSGDTLLYAGSIFVDVGMMGLFRSEINVNNLELTDVVANMIREEPDTVFNYQFIIDAFAPSDTSATSDQEETPPEDEDEKADEWTFSLGNLSLENIRFRNIDHFTGTDMQLSLDQLDADLEPADLMNEKFHTGEISIDQPQIVIQMSPPSVPPEPDTTEMPEIDLAIKALIIEDPDFRFSSFDGTQMQINSDLLALYPEEISLHEYLIAIEEIEAEQLAADFNIPVTPEQEETTPPTTKTAEKEPTSFSFDFSEIMEWDIILDKLDITGSSFSMKQGDEPVKRGEFDPGNISLENINLHLSEAKVNPDQLDLTIENTSMDFSNQFSIADLNMDVNLGASSEVTLHNLTTSQSQLSFSLNTSGSLLDFSQQDLTGYRYDVSISETHIQQDLAFFVPVMNEYYFQWPDNEGIRLGARVEGTLDHLTIDSLWLAGPDFFATQFSGEITGLPNMDSLYVDLPALTLFAAPDRILANLPDTLGPQGIQLPDTINLEANARGSLDNFEAAMDVNTSMGDIVVSAKSAGGDERKEAFEGNLNTESFHVGKLLQQTETLPEPIALAIDVNGVGFKPETMWLNTTLTLDKLVYNDHEYDEIVVDASLRDSVATLQSAYKDSIIDFDLEASYGAFQENPELKANLGIEYVYLHELGISDESLLAKTDMKVDLVFDTEDFFNGYIQISNTSFATEGNIYNVPEVFIEALAYENINEIALRSQFLDVDYRGNFSPLEVGSVLANHFDRYYSEQQSSDTLAPDTDKYFNISLSLTPTELLTEVLVESLDTRDTLDVMFSYDSSLQVLHLEANWPEARYQNIELDSLDIIADSNKGELDFEATLRRLSTGELTIHQFGTNGTLTHQKLDFGLGFKDEEGDSLYHLGGDLDFTDSLYVLQIDPDEMLLNGEHWSIPEENRIEMGSEYINIQDFTIENNGREIRAATRDIGRKFPAVNVELRQIDLGRFTDFSGNDYPSLGGEFNGDISIRNIFGDPAFVADLSINNFAFRGDTLGDIEISGENPSPDYFELMASLQSDANDLVVSGNYRTGENQQMDIEADLNRISLPTLEGFAFGEVTDTEGTLTGNIDLTGTMQEPKVSGKLQMNDAFFKVSAINAGYFVKGEEIVFANKEIRLDNFALEDSLGRTASLSGNIDVADLDRIGFDLALNSDNFLLMNVQPNENDLYHGRILIDSDLSLTGTQLNPTIEGRIRLNEESNFTFTIPQTDPEAIGDEGVVEFISFSDTLFFELAKETAETPTVTSSFDLLDISVNVDIDNKTDVKIIIDEYAGDFLQIQGGGELSFGMDPGGRVSLSGRYEMEDGEYLLTFYDVVRRNFNIQQGSSIVWSGNPLDARVDMTAVYNIRTSAADLLASQASEDQEQSAAVRQQFPFLVYLNMDGKLEEPEISFELDLPDEYQNALDGSVMARLNQINRNESELNKQVFALLILGNFIPQNPFAASGGGDFSTTARSSASQILTQQLNRLSDRYIKGVDINFDVQSFQDYEGEETTGRTELQMEVSRNFFDERLEVTVGGNMELEDETRRQRNPADIAGDFSIEYLLTPEGNLILKGFRNKNYGDIFEGEVIDTGVSLRFSKNYNKFRELFRKEEETTVTEEE